MSSTTPLDGGITLRWLNTAGFELILPGGRHLLVDPWLDSSDTYPFPLDKIERADYLLLSHIHFDHADSVGTISKKFPNCKIFVGDLSADPLCTWQDIDVNRIYRMRGGEVYTFSDVTIEAFSGRHTEATRPAPRSKQINPDGTLKYDMWFGSLEMLNFKVTAADGTSVVIWGGMTTEEQINRMKGAKFCDVALMHVSPKQDHAMFADLCAAMGAKVIVPHHYDAWEALFAKNPDMLNDFPIPPEEVNAANILSLVEKAIATKNPHATFMVLDHHVWCHFGLSVTKG